MTNFNSNTVTACIIPSAVYPKQSIFSTDFISQCLRMSRDLHKKEKPALLAWNLPNTIIRHHFSYHNFFHTYTTQFSPLSFYALSSSYYGIKLSKEHFKPPHFVRHYTYTFGTGHITHSKFNSFSILECSIHTTVTTYVQECLLASVRGSASHHVTKNCRLSYSTLINPLIHNNNCLYQLL
jgi:hypothetical protein